MIPEDLAYMAALIDTMGSLRIRSTPEGTRLPSVTVSSANARLLQILSEATGTNLIVISRNYDRRGCSEHCDGPHDHVDSTTSRWNITGARATVFLNALVPYMRIQTDEAEELLSIGLGAPRKAATAERMRDLGWSLPEEWTA
jgi:hypothetical protein